jgi:tetratricopeptide (TPR) repeat protein
VSPDIQLAFYREVRERYSLSFQLEMLMARTLLDAKEYEEAREILDRIVKEEDRAEAWYLLARIAEQEKDWDQMELAIQKAVVRDPANPEYRMKFSQSLARQQKYAVAEQQATKAISLRDKPSPWYYSHRASMRWSQKNYQGALEDWQQANKIDPENAAFYGQIGRAYKKMGYDELAIIAYGSALQHDPENEKYKKELGIQ